MVTELIGEEGRGPRGPRKRQAVLDAARRVFSEKGYNASMEEVAFEAEVSKQTIYNQFGSKEQLFHAMVDDRVSEMVAPLTEAAADADPRDVLTRIGRLYHTKVIGPDNVKMIRAMIAAPHAAGVMRDLYAHGPSRLARTFADWLTAQHAAGRLKIDDAVLTAEHFISFTFGHVYMKRLFGIETPLDEADIERRVTYCVDAFLKAHAV
jgi:TetR/AcrR family transcriptional repressor of mexJK operon